VKVLNPKKSGKNLNPEKKSVTVPSNMRDERLER